ncbi:DUF4239 domain-containing protein [Kitasatospora sp. NBC_01246]|uniref:bestrophin-like domain n=1 Tax=Kitasatospora sp. NBC_01246 TaxID=2903570 RepID=UPI002E30BB95|nr:hypothetical protein [Kitasatospora sp. NBC_01246]
MSNLLQTLAVVLGAALVAAAIVLLKGRFFPVPEDAEPREDVAEYIAMMVGVLYALVLGLSMVSVWEIHSGALNHSQDEAGALHQTYLLADLLPPDRRDALRTTATAYAVQVVHAEWPRMAAREPLGPDGWGLLNQLRTVSQASSQDDTPTQQNASQEMLAVLTTLDDARRGREASAMSSLSTVLWVGLVIGGTLTVAFMFLFGIKRSATHVVMVMGLTGLIAFTILLIQQLDAPFDGFLAVTPQAFTRYFPFV